MPFFPFFLCDSDLHISIDASTSSSTFDEDDGFHILDIRFHYDWIFTPLRPQIKQASPSTAFLLLLLPTRLLGKHNLILWSLLQASWDKTRQDVYANWCPSCLASFFYSLSRCYTFYLSAVSFSFSLQPSPRSSVLCIWWWWWCIMPIANTWRWRFFEPFNFLV